MSEPILADMLYLDAEHFILTTESGPLMEPKARVVPSGRPFQGFMPCGDSERPASSKEKTA